MGTCYSIKARGADPYTLCPTEMPESEPVNQGSSSPSNSGSTGLRRPNPAPPASSSQRNSNEQPGQESERTALTNISDNTPRMPQTSSKTEPTNANKPKNRFGFKAPASTKKPDTNSNLMTTSTESAASIASSNSGSGKETSVDRKGSKRPKSGAFEAEGADKWLMIDDSRSNSRASSLKSKRSASSKERQLAAVSDDVNNGNNPQGPSSGPDASDKSSEKDESSVGAGSKTSGGTRLPSKLRGPFNRFSGGSKKDVGSTNGSEGNKWVKATPASCDQTDAGAHFSKDNKKGASNGKSSEPSSKKNETVEKKPEANGKKPEQRSGRGAVNFLRSFGKPKTPSSSSQNGAQKNKSSTSEKSKATMSKSSQQLKALSSEPTRNVSKSKGLLVKAPLAVIDSTETTSIGSINSDDLMLDTEINLDDYEDDSFLPAHSCVTGSLDRTFHSTKSRSRTRSQESVDLQKSANQPGGVLKKTSEGSSTAATVAKYDRKPLLNRRHISESSGLPGRHNSGGSQKLSAYRRNQNEPLQELATLLHDNPAVRRRPPKLSKIGRPASFPCPVKKDGSAAAASSQNSSSNREREEVEEKMYSLPATTTTASTTNIRALKPPRQTPSIGDDEHVTLDGFTFRHMIQDMTNLKTMLLRLKRVIQEDEFGSWKNGLRLSGSQPNSPMKEDLTLLAFLEESDEAPNTEKLVQENLELKQQLQVLQRQLEEQETTVKLLQHQMTKYEFGGEVGAGDGVSMNTATTQTDKQDQPQSTTKTQTANASRNMAAVARYRPEVSSDTLQANESISPLSNTSPPASSGCLAVASADEVFERDQNGVLEQSHDSSLSLDIVAEAEHPTASSNPATDTSFSFNGTSVLEEAVIRSSNETVTTDTSDYVSDSTVGSTPASATTTTTTTTTTAANSPPKVKAAESKLRGIPKPFGGSGCSVGSGGGGGSNKLQTNNHIPKQTQKSAIPNSRSNPTSFVTKGNTPVAKGSTNTSVAKGSAGVGKPSKTQSQLRKPGQGGQFGASVGAGRGRGSYQSRLPAIGIKRVARSNPQLHSFADQKTVSG